MIDNNPTSIVKLKPTYRFAHVPNGYMVYIKPPPEIAAEHPEVGVHLTPGQFARFKKWSQGRQRDLIQDLLPDISVEHREMLMSGLTDEDFAKFTNTNTDT